MGVEDKPQEGRPDPKGRGPNLGFSDTLESRRGSRCVPVARLLQDLSARPVKVGVRGRLAGGGDFAEAHERRPGPAVTSATTWLATTAA
jgi:hypothetical protein